MNNMSSLINTESDLNFRHIVVVGFIFSCFRDQWYVLANRRGTGTNSKELWNCPSGYLRFNETAREACSKKILEETGIIIPEDKLYYEDYDDTLTLDQQNVVLQFTHFDRDGVLLNQTFNDIYTDNNEVMDIKWIITDNIENYSWAFNHLEEIKSLINMYLK